MRDYMHYSDIPLLVNQGFTYSSLSISLLWGKDKNGDEYQVQDDGDYLRFGKRRPSGGVDRARVMTREKFEELFHGTV